MMNTRKIRKAVVAVFIAIGQIFIIGIRPQTYIWLWDNFHSVDTKSSALKCLVMLGDRSDGPVVEYLATHGLSDRRVWPMYHTLRDLGDPAHRELLRLIGRSAGLVRFKLVIALQESFHDYSYLPWMLLYVQNPNTSDSWSSVLHYSLWMSMDEGEVPAVYGSLGCGYDFVDWYSEHAARGVFPKVRFKRVDKYFAKIEPL